MFRRKEEETSTENDASLNKDVKSEPKAETKPSNAPSASNFGSNATPTSAASPTPAAAPTPAEQKVAPMSQPSSAYRPAPAPAPAPANRPGMSPSAPSGSKDNTAGGKKRILTVGNDILLKGEIATCDRLVIEGAVDAKLNDVHTVEIAETGSFKGSAQIEDAEISGLFEGDLVVRNRLIIYSTGKVRGKITYGEIEIERGGEMTGEIKTGSSAAAEKNENKENKDKSKAA
ncbi:MAG: polymer-forming cytoskeletal protein [Alphaproteobacteria bacterium]|nr:polymer-forming cytoskeletal protein [Alphaproteobacteria bacterium]